MLDSGENEFELKGAWLHGAPAPNFKADVSMSLTPAPTAFSGYNDFVFSNPSKSYSFSRETIWEGNLDKNSEAKFTGEIESTGNESGMMKANMTARIFEPSGAFSVMTKSFPYSPFERYCGLRLPKGDAARGMLLTDTDHTADVVLLDKNGEKVKIAALVYAVYKLEWKWWWEKDALTKSTFVSSKSESLIDEGELYIEDGVGSFNFRVNYPSWGRYLVEVRDLNGHSAAKIVYIDWPGWAGRAQEGGSGSASSVILTADKKQYSAGEVAQISFASGEGGRALVSVEKNGSIVKQEWIETKKETTVYKLPLTKEMSPNVYVHVSLLQQHQQTANSLPVRLFGVVPVMVDNPETKLEPVITSADVFEPNKDVSVSVSEKNGRAMTYTLAVVDEGLLGLTNYHAPDLRSDFYKKEASRIKSWDLFRYVMNAYSGKLESLLLVGGGDGGEDNRDRDANRFTPIVKYFGPYTLAAGQKQAITFNTGEYIGAVRAIVVAGENGAYGSTEKNIPVKTDLMIQSAIPRTLGTGETIDIPLAVFNGTDKPQTVTVALNVSGALSASETKTVSVGAMADATAIFTVKPEMVGTAKFSFSARTAQAKAESNASVEVLSRGVFVSYRTPFELDKGKSKKVSVSSPFEKGTAKLDLEMSAFPQMNLDARLGSLIRYPHGCIEQITSGGFPQIYIPSFLNLSAEQADSVKSNVKSVISRYSQYATVTGGMGYWPGNTEPHEWGSCYALHFLSEARRNGYFVSDSLFDALAGYVSQKASKWTDSDGDYSVQAYRVYALALAGRSNISAMNRLSALQNSFKTEEPRMLLAASYALSGRQKIAKEIFDDVKVSFGKGKKRSTGGDFYSQNREKALWLFVDTLTGGSRNSLRVAREIGDTLSSDTWLSTQETAWSLIALIPYYQGQRETGAAFAVTDAADKSENIEISASSVIKNLSASDGKTQEVEVKNTGKTVLYGLLTSSGMSKAGSEKEASDGLSLKVSYEKDGDDVDPKSLKLGDTFTITVKLRNDTSSAVNNIALTLPVPTCWEISNTRLGLDSDSYTQSQFDYQDIKDTAVYTYLSLDGKQSASFTFSATVAYSGAYFVPAIHAEAMYDDSFRAIIPGIYAEAKR